MYSIFPRELYPHLPLTLSWAENGFSLPVAHLFPILREHPKETNHSRWLFTSLFFFILKHPPTKGMRSYPILWPCPYFKWQGPQAKNQQAVAFTALVYSGAEAGKSMLQSNNVQLSCQWAGVEGVNGTLSAFSFSPNTTANWVYAHTNMFKLGHSHLARTYSERNMYFHSTLTPSKIKS